MDQYNFTSKEKLIKSLVYKDGKFYCNEKEIGIAAKGEPGRTPKKGKDYFDGKDGIGKPPEHEWEGTKIRFQNPDGTWGRFVNLKGKEGDPGITPKKGVDYFDGEPGRTPEKGVDYKDGEDGEPGIEPEEMANIRIDLALMKDSIEAMKNSIKAMEERLAGVKDGEDGYTPKKGVDYFDGDPGRTPKKGVDYFDGENGKTPVKGVDYFDGKDAEIPESHTMQVVTRVEKMKNGELMITYEQVKFYKKD